MSVVVVGGFDAPRGGNGGCAESLPALEEHVCFFCVRRRRGGGELTTEIRGGGGLLGLITNTVSFYSNSNS